MQIDEKHIQEVITVYKTQYQMDLTHEEAWGILHRLCRLFEGLAKSDPPQMMLEKEADRPTLDDRRS